jgi:hypothetical protein
MKAKTLCSLFVVVAMLSMAPLGLHAKTLGMVADNTTDSVTVFDADTHAILGTVPIDPGFVIGDVLITPDLKRGFVTNLNNQIFVIDLTTSPPSLAGGTNPIFISNVGEDLSISPNGKFLVIAGGSNGPPEPISVVDIAARAEISTFSTGFDTSSVDVCSDNSVLAPASSEADAVFRLTLSGTGTLTDTGEALSLSNPVNVYCAPGSKSGVVIQFAEFENMTAFAIPGFVPSNGRFLSGGIVGRSGAINSAGNRVFARSNDPGSVDVFEFNSAFS